MIEWEIIQDRFSKADDTMKFHIKERLRKILYPETTNLKPHSEPVKTKSAPKKVKPTQDDNPTKRHPSYFEHVDSHFLDYSTLKSQKSIYKGARITKPLLSPSMSKIIYIEKISFLCTNTLSRL